MNLTWTERIAIAKERGFFTKEDKDLADSWKSDPIGERLAEGKLDPRKLVKSTGSPLDDELRRFGFEFLDAVYRDEPFLADDLFGLIHRTIDKLTERKTQ